MYLLYLLILRHRSHEYLHGSYCSVVVGILFFLGDKAVTPALLDITRDISYPLSIKGHL